MDHAHLKSTCHQFLDSLIGQKKRHTLCLNIAEDGFEAHQVAADYLKSKSVGEVESHSEPTPTEFTEILGNLEARYSVVDFADLDKNRKCKDLLFEHVQNEDINGKLVVVSRAWNSRNTDKERELRKHCLFYQQNLAKPAKK